MLKRKDSESQFKKSHKRFRGEERKRKKREKSRNEKNRKRTRKKKKTQSEKFAKHLIHFTIVSRLSRREGG